MGVGPSVSYRRGAVTARTQPMRSPVVQRNPKSLDTCALSRGLELPVGLTDPPLARYDRRVRRVVTFAVFPLHRAGKPEKVQAMGL